MYELELRDATSFAVDATWEHESIEMNAMPAKLVVSLGDKGWHAYVVPQGWAALYLTSAEGKTFGRWSSYFNDVDLEFCDSAQSALSAALCAGGVDVNEPKAGQVWRENQERSARYGDGIDTVRIWTADRSSVCFEIISGRNSPAEGQELTERHRRIWPLKEFSDVFERVFP